MPVQHTIAEALKEAEKFMSTPGIEGVAQGKNKGEDCIKIFTSLPVKEIKKQLPQNILGFEVVIEFTGPIQALDNLS